MDICTSMVQERKKLESILENADLKTKADAIEFADALTRIIWNHSMLGLIYDYYDENILLKVSNGRKITNLDDVVMEFLGMQAAFPDMRVYIVESFASEDGNGEFTVYQRSYCEGTNTGASQYGMPTGNKLNENNSMGQTVYKLKKVQNKWKVVTEYTMRSQSTIEKLLKNIQ